MRQSPFTAVYDACVLYPAPLRDFLMWLGLSGRFRARWSPQIHEEWKCNLLAKRPDLTREQIDRTSALMDQAIPDGLVTDHEDLVAGLTLPDPGDRHVLAAAIRCSASVIVTFNEKDFPQAALVPYGIEAQHPDLFVDNLFDRRPRRRMTAPAHPVRQYASAAGRHGQAIAPRSGKNTQDAGHPDQRRAKRTAVTITAT